MYVKVQSQLTVWLSDSFVDNIQPSDKQVNGNAFIL